MLRKLILAVCVAALIVSGCGRQVTPNPQGSSGSGLPAGFMQVKVTTAAPMDLTNIRYVFVFNTTGSGGMPYANGFQTNFQNYSFAIVVGGNGQQSSPVLIQYVRQPGLGGGATTVVQTTIPYTVQQLQFNLNSNNQNTQLTVTFDRRLFNGVVATPSPSPGTNNSIWYVNWFTTDASGNPIDAPGLGGPTDTSFSFPALTVTGAFDLQWTFQSGWPQVNPPSAQLAGGEVLNSP